MPFNPYALILIISAIISGSLAVYIWQRRASIPSGILFTLMMVSITIWSLAYGLELASSDFRTMRFWLSIEYFGIATAPVFWLLFTIRYTGGGDWLDDWRVALLFIVPALTIILNLTNELHYFYYTSIALDTTGPFPLLALERGPWYWFNVVYSYLAMVLGTLILVRFWHQTPRPYRGQTTVLILAAVIPLGLNFLYLLGFRPFAHLDLSPVAFTATGVLMALGIARLSLLKLSPIARNTLFEHLRDPALVIDHEGRLTDFNQAATNVLDPVLSQRIGWFTNTALNQWPTLADFCYAQSEEHAEIHLATRPGEIYEAVRTALTDRRGRNVGQIVVLHNITARHQSEQAMRISTALAHERVRTLEALSATFAEIATEHTTDRLLQAIVNRVATLLKVELADLLIYDEAADNLVLAASYPPDPQRYGRHLAFNETSLGYVACTRRSLILRANQDWAEALPGMLTSEMKMSLAVPLLQGEQLVGVLGVSSNLRERDFDGDDERLLMLFAQQATVSLLNSRLYTQLLLDPLTEINNRGRFFELAEKTLANALADERSLVIALIDLDHFKQVNDTYGHRMGDETLRHIAVQCRDQLPPEALLGRIGGEEFAVLLEDEGVTNIYALLETMREQIAAQPIKSGEQSMHITASIGVAVLKPDHPESIDELLERADRALYRAKSGGRNQVQISCPENDATNGTPYEGVSALTAHQLSLLRRSQRSH